MFSFLVKNAGEKREEAGKKEKSKFVGTDEILTDNAFDDNDDTDANDAREPKGKKR